MTNVFWLAGMLAANLCGAIATGNFAGPYLIEEIAEPPVAVLPAPAQQAQGSDARVPILPPIPAGACPTCGDAPSREEILRALPKVPAGIPRVWEEFRDDIEITTEKLVDRVDPPRFIPLIGPAQLHHCHWKCTVHFTETTVAGFPYPLRLQKKCAEVVYIDKDRLHLYVSPEPPANPASCPGGRVGKTLTRNAAKCEHAPQVQLGVVLAQVNRSALPNLAYHLAGKQKGSGTVSSGILKDKDGFIELLQSLRTPGLAKIMAHPRLVTLSGRSGSFFSGSQIPVTTYSDSGDPCFAYKEIGTKISCLPTVQANGKILLEVHSEITWASTASDSGFRMQSAQVTIVMDAGQTLAIGGLTQNDVKQDLVILVTPQLLEPGDCTKAPQMPPPPFPVPIGSDATRQAPHRVTAPDVLLIEAAQLLPRKPGRIESCERQILGDHLVRPDGTISLGIFGPVFVEGMTPTQVKLVIENHLSKYLVDPRISVNVSAYNSRKLPSVVQAGYTEERPKVVLVSPPAKAESKAPMSVKDVVRMSQKDISIKLILRQIELTNAMFNLTVDDIIELHDQGVSEDIISAMQERRTGAAIVQPRPVGVSPFCPASPPRPSVFNRP